jgi:hypothetical protein
MLLLTLRLPYAYPILKKLRMLPSRKTSQKCTAILFTFTFLIANARSNVCLMCVMRMICIPDMPYEPTG